MQLAQKLGKRPSEITKWLSGQHNFTLRTIAQLSAFFGEPLVWALIIVSPLFAQIFSPIATIPTIYCTISTFVAL